MGKQNLSPETIAKRKAYNATPEQVHRREMQNAARAEMIRAGRAHKGDGKDVGHVVPLDQNANKGANSMSNLQIQTVQKNRGWKRDGNQPKPTR
jgi:hypothetical protein